MPHKKLEELHYVTLDVANAMIGALENKNWVDIARTERESILMALEGFAELEKELLNEGIQIKN